MLSLSLALLLTLLVRIVISSTSLLLLSKEQQLQQQPKQRQQRKYHESFLKSSTISNSSTKTIGPFCHTCTIPTTKLIPTTTTSTTSITSRTLFDYTKYNNNNTNQSNTNNICFQSRIELELAVTEYMINNSPTSTVASRYGWPINVWCVFNITDFSFLFSPINNVLKASFNEDISKWDMSNAITVEQMFMNNIIFNQNISTWKFSLSLNNTYRMFYNTKSFNYNLCSWGTTGSTSTNPFQQSLLYMNVTQMFRDTSCPNTFDPMYDNSTMQHPNPFCYDCISTGNNNNNTTSQPSSSSSSSSPSPIIPGIQQPTQPQVSSILPPTQVPIMQQQQQQQFVPTSITIPSPSLSSIGMNQTTPTVPPIPTVTTTATTTPAPIAINGNSSTTTLIPITTTNETIPMQIQTTTTTTPIESSTSTPNNSSSTSSLFGIQLYNTQHLYYMYGSFVVLSLIHYC